MTNLPYTLNKINFIFKDIPIKNRVTTSEVFNFLFNIKVPFGCDINVGFKYSEEKKINVGIMQMFADEQTGQCDIDFNVKYTDESDEIELCNDNVKYTIKYYVNPISYTEGLTGIPTITMFKINYRRYTNFSVGAIDIPNIDKNITKTMKIEDDNEVNEVNKKLKKYDNYKKIKNTQNNFNKKTKY